MSSPLPPKKDVALALLERSSVFVYLDPRREGVVTPVGFKRDPKLVLQVGLNMAVAIPDLSFDDKGMSCTLSFARTPFFCIIPWHAVFALTDENGQGIVWPDDVPRELVDAQAQAQRRAALRVVRDEPAPEPPAEAPPAPAAAKKAGGKKKPSKKSEEAAKAERIARAIEGLPVDDVDDAPKPKRVSKKPAAAKAEAGEKPGKRAKKEPSAASEAKATKTKKPAKKAAKGETEATPAAAKEAPAAEAQPSLFDANATAKPAPPPPAPAPSPASLSRPSGKPKRELPPYLRVVK